MSQIKVQVLLFAKAQELAGSSTLEILAEQGIAVSDLLDLITQKIPALAPYLKHCRIAVDREFQSLDSTIAQDAEVAIIPPVSGG